MNVRALPFAVALAGFATIRGAAQLSTAGETAVNAYRSAVSAAESGRSPGAIEAAFESLGPLRAALMEIRNERNLLESLPEEEFQRLRRGLAGAIVNRDEVVFVEPDPGYFARLAAARGDGADRAFFLALKATYPGSVWPVYVDQRSDYGGCSRFGSMSLVQTYRAWADFQRRFPGRYVEGARKEADAVIGHLTTSTCACGDLASVEHELRQFLRTFPKSGARARVDRRLQSVRAGRSDIRAGCVPG